MKEKSIFDDMEPSVFDDMEESIFDDAEPEVEDKVVYSEDFKDSLREELRKEISKIPMGKILEGIIKKKEEKASKAAEKLKESIEKEIEETEEELEEEIKKEVSTVKAELVESINKIKKNFASLRNELANQPAMQFGGFAPPNPLTGAAGTFLKNTDQTWSGLSWAAGGGGAVSSVSNSDGSLTISPTTGAVIASINLSHENTWVTGQIFNDPDVLKTPLAPASSSATFVLSGSGIVANGSSYQYYIYSYWYTGTTYAYDAVGIYTPTGTDPNDGLTYNQALTWVAGADANGYLIYDFLTGQWLDVGNVLTYTITLATPWLGAGSFPALTPNSLTEPGHPIWLNKSQDWGTTNFNAIAMGLSGTNHLQFRWLYAGGTSGGGALRFESDDGTLREINANLYGTNANITNQLTVGTVAATSISASSITDSGISTKQVLYSNSGLLSGDAGFEWDATNNRLLVASASFTAASKLQIDGGTSTASDLRGAVLAVAVPAFR